MKRDALWYAISTVVAVVVTVAGDLLFRDYRLG
jgi:hypothetical protein